MKTPFKNSPDAWWKNVVEIDTICPICRTTRKDQVPVRHAKKDNNGNVKKQVTQKCLLCRRHERKKDELRLRIEHISKSDMTQDQKASFLKKLNKEINVKDIYYRDFIDDFLCYGWELVKQVYSPEKIKEFIGKIPQSYRDEIKDKWGFDVGLACWNIRKGKKIA